MHRLTAVLSAMISAGCLGGVFSPVSAAVQWAPASSAIIHPGVQLFTNGAQCTANFIFTNSAHVYVGQAAHCSGAGLNWVCRCWARSGASVWGTAAGGGAIVC